MQCNKVILLWYFLINFKAELISGIVDAPVDKIIGTLVLAIFSISK